jgi:Uma2 family endonuclease
MTRVASTGLSSTGPPPDDPFRYGWRYVQRTLPDGGIEFDQVPLTLEDVLHPQEDDVIPENTQQERDRRYLTSVFEKRYVHDPHTLTLSDCLIDWGIRGLRAHSPDVTVLEGVRTKKGPWGTFRLREEGGHPLLVVEIVSPHTRNNDVVTKVEHYHRVGVPWYVLVDWEHEDGPRQLIVYRDTPKGYVEVQPDAAGRVLLDPTGILISLREERVVCFDAATARELGDYVQVCRQLEQEVAARQAAEQRQREEAAARQAAEQRQREEAAARQAAEQRQREEAAARQAAEHRAEAAEDRLRHMEERLRRLQDGPS